MRRVQLPAPADDVEAYAVDGPPGMAALLAVRGGIDGLEPDYLFSGINIGTNTGHSILHSGTVGAALTAATFGLSGLAVSLAVSKPMAWEYAYAYVEEAMTLLEQAPRATVLNVNVPVPRPGSEPQKLRWAELDRFGSFRVAVAERREAEVQLEYRSTGTGHELDPDSDTALVDSGTATITALEAIRAVPPEELPFGRPPPEPEPRLAPGPGSVRADAARRTDQPFVTRSSSRSASARRSPAPSAAARALRASVSASDAERSRARASVRAAVTALRKTRLWPARRSCLLPSSGPPSVSARRRRPPPSPRTPSPRAAR